jgi:hypothetical protein
LYCSDDDDARARSCRPVKADLVVFCERGQKTRARTREIATTSNTVLDGEAEENRSADAQDLGLVDNNKA